jgi:hypothetical protein
MKCLTRMFLVRHALQANFVRTRCRSSGQLLENRGVEEDPEGWIGSLLSIRLWLGSS